MGRQRHSCGTRWFGPAANRLAFGAGNSARGAADISVESNFRAWAGQDTPITPFWRCIPRFFRFPAYRQPLVRNLGVSLIMAGAMYSGLWFVLALAALATSVVIARYGFLVIERASQGYLKPDHYPSVAGEEYPWRPYKMFAILVIATFLVSLVGVLSGSRVLLVVGMVLVALAMPASVMSMAQSGSLREAMNPVRLAGIVQGIGAPYLVLCLFLLLLMTGSNQAFQLVAPLFKDRYWLLMGISTFVGNYFFLIMCALIGYVMYQYHAALGVAVLGPGDSGRPVLKGRIDLRARQRDALIGQHVAAGELREAIALVGEDLAERPGDLSLHARMRRLLQANGDHARLNEFGDRYLALLVKSGNLDEALGVLEEETERRPNYVLHEAGMVVSLARRALERGRYERAGALLRGFDKRWPGHAELPEVYLLGGLLLAEGARDEARARRLFEHVLAAYPGSAAASQARRFLQLADPSQPGPTDRGGRLKASRGNGY